MRPINNTAEKDKKIERKRKRAHINVLAMISASRKNGLISVTPRERDRPIVDGQINRSNFFVLPMGRWAKPGGTAIPGQPVSGARQALTSHSKFKNRINSERVLGPGHRVYQTFIRFCDA